MARKSRYAPAKEERFILKTAIYVRLSREDGDKLESDSIANQKYLIENYINNNRDEFHVINTYCDDNYTGTNFNRPGFLKMMEDVKQKKINCVIVKDLSRFGRDYIGTGNYIEREFPKYGVRFIAINDNIDTSKKQYDMMMPVKNIFNEQYARDISTKVQSALKVKQQRGEFIGAFASYGYIKDPDNKGKLIVDEYASIIVKRVFDMFLSGKGKNGIAIALNREGILCPSEYKKQNGLKYNNGQRLSGTQYWTYATIHRMLQNEIYIGNMVQHKNNRSNFRSKTSRTIEKENWIIVKNTHEPIIDIDTWNSAQDMLQRDTRIIDFNHNVSLFAGFMKCKDCGRAMNKVVRNGVTSYLCGSYKRYGAGICTSHSIKEDLIYSIVLEHLQSLIGGVMGLSAMLKNMNKIAGKDASKNIKKNADRLAFEKDKIYRLKKSAYEDYKLGELSEADYLRYKDDYENQERHISAQLAALTGSLDESAKTIEESDWIRTFKKYKNISALDREVLSVFIENIYISDNREIEIIPKFIAETEMLEKLVVKVSEK